MFQIIALLSIPLLMLIALNTLLTRRYRKCPTNRAIVRTGTGGLAVCSGGGIIVVPFLHRYGMLSLEPIRVELPGSLVVGADSASRWQFTVGVGLTWQMIAFAAPHMLDKGPDEISRWITDTIADELSRTTAGSGGSGERAGEKLRATLGDLGLELLSWGPVQNPPLPADVD